MKFKVFEEAKKQEQEVFFRLRPTDEGGICLEAVDADGVHLSQGNILTVTKNGTIRLCEFVSDEIGLRLDSDSRVVVEK